MSEYPHGDDMLKLLPYVARHAHGPQDTRPLQSVLIRGDRARTNILAWPMPDIAVEVHDEPTLRAATLTTRVAISVTWFMPDYYEVLDEVMEALPLGSLVTLTAQDRTRLDEMFWLFLAPRWPLLQCVRLAAPAARGFREMLLLQDNDEPECPLFPSLTKLDLIGDTALSERRTLRLCDALMKRVEKGVPLETLDLRMCRTTSRAVRLLSEIVVDVRAPEARGLVIWCPFVPDNDSEVLDDSDDDDDGDSYASDDDEEGDEDEEENY
jgi:hypothetical protein